MSRRREHYDREEEEYFREERLRGRPAGKHYDDTQLCDEESDEEDYRGREREQYRHREERNRGRRDEEDEYDARRHERRRGRCERGDDRNDTGRKGRDKREERDDDDGSWVENSSRGRDEWIEREEDPIPKGRGRENSRKGRDERSEREDSSKGRETRNGRESRNGRGNKVTGEAAIEEYLEMEIEMLNKKKAMLEDLIEQQPKQTQLTLKQPEAQLFLEGFQAEEVQMGRRKTVMIVDRENNCTQFLNGVTRLPKWLELYVVWNPKSKNLLDLHPSVKKAACLIEAEHNVLKACTFLAGMAARQHAQHADETDMYLIYNRTHSQDSLNRYSELEDVLALAGFNVEPRNGAGANFADFLEHRGEKYSKYTKEPPKNATF
eukprot:TRINITY_DN19936_c0_g1_i1.p1 TRINITY_DN19936_c0_g1~~TRINITY_DN19936_c0_g1_i1.p1  ORF type:complete len:379 (+),score=99.68 TRINITY_DN19936_c0_g1_i1:803-1939(+)